MLSNVLTLFPQGGGEGRAPAPTGQALRAAILGKDSHGETRVQVRGDMRRASLRVKLLCRGWLNRSSCPKFAIPC